MVAQGESVYASHSVDAAIPDDIDSAQKWPQCANITTTSRMSWLGLLLGL